MRGKSMMAVCLALILSVSFCACGDVGNVNGGSSDGAVSGSDGKGSGDSVGSSSSKSLYEHGLDVISLQKEKVDSDVYEQLMGSELTLADESGKALERIRKVDYSDPKTVYRVEFSDDFLPSVLSAMGEEAGNLDDMSDALKTSVESALMSNLVKVMNGRNSGTDSIVISSVYSAGKVFSTDEVDRFKMYFYIFDGGYPVCVSFVPGEGGAASASGCFLMDEEFQADTPEELKKWLGGGYFEESCQVEEIKRE